MRKQRVVLEHHADLALVGRQSVTRSPSMRISPLSGMRKPATRLSSVVLPQPEGPSRVMNLAAADRQRTLVQRDTVAEALGHAVETHGAVHRGRDVSLRSVLERYAQRRMLNVEHLSETEEDVGEGQSRRSRRCT